MKTKLLRSALLASGVFMTFGLASQAAAGVVVGRVSDASGARYLSGAQVRILELGRTVETSRDGSFRIADVAPGTYTVAISYSGAEDELREIVVPETGDAVVDVALAPVAGAVDDNVLVIGQRASLSSSVSRQRAADGVESVLTRDSVGQFPDQNVAEALRRAPGVNILNDQGEGRFVAVRGLNPDLNSSSINGARVPAPEEGVRGVALDVISSDLIESIEIKKSLTPDMDGDTLGASIEINTTSSLDRKDPLLSLRAEGAFGNLNNDLSHKYSVDFSRRLTEKLGVAGGFNWNRRNFATDNIEADGWGESESGVVFPEALEYRDYDVQRTRFGGALSFDYEVNESTRLFARGLYSVFDDQEYRGRLIFETDELAVVGGDANSVEFESGVEVEVDPGEFETSFIEVKRDMKDRFESQTIQSYVFGGKTETGPWRFNYEGSWSRASEKENGSLDPIEFTREFEDPGELGVMLDFSDWRKPGYSVLNGADAFFDASEYELDDVEVTSLSRSVDTEYAGRFDIAREFALDQGSVELQFGGKARFREKTYNATIDFYELDDITADQFLGPQSYTLADIEPQLSQTAFREFFEENFDLFERGDLDSDFDSAVSDYVVGEDVYAGYGLARYDNGTLRAIAGVRMEHTEYDISGNLVELIEEGAEVDGEVLDEDTLFVTPIGFKRSFTHWLPSLNLRYEVAEDVLLRGAVYRSILRPNPGQIAPRFLIEESDENEREGEFGNPDLDPYRAINFDASAEWYFAPNAVISGGMFYKSIQDFIVDAEFEEITFNGVYADEAIIPINGDKATVLGAEFNYQHSLDFLPGALNGFIVGFNYTFTDAEGEVNGRTIPLPASSRHTFNATLGYDKGPFDIRVAAAYRAKYLDELGGDPEEDRMVEDHIQYDVSVKYDLTDKIQMTGDFVNAANAPYVAYQSGPGGNRLLQYEEYSWTAKFGVRVRL